MAVRSRWMTAAVLFFGAVPALAGGARVEPGTELASFVVSCPLNDVQVFPDGEIVAVGNREALHVNRLGTSRVSRPRKERRMRRIGVLAGVWGAAPDNVWAVARTGHVLHWNGKKWSIVDTGSRVLLDVWGSSPNDIFAVGKGGLILHWNGARWAAMKSGSGEILTRIWGSSGKDVYAVGEHGTVLHYDGSGWRREKMPFGDSFDMVSGSGSDDVFVAGWGGVCLHFDGVVWKEIGLGTRGVQDLVVDSEAGRAWAVTLDQGVLHFDGRTWSRFFPLPDEFYATHLATAPNGALVIAGFHGSEFGTEASGHSVTSRDGALVVMATQPTREGDPT